MTRRAHAAYRDTHRHGAAPDTAHRRDRARGKARDRGASAIEYGLVLFAVAALVCAAVFATGGALRGSFEHSTACLAAPLRGGEDTPGRPGAPDAGAGAPADPGVAC